MKGKDWKDRGGRKRERESQNEGTKTKKGKKDIEMERNQDKILRWSEREKLLLRERNDHIDHGGKRERWSK